MGSHVVLNNGRNGLHRMLVCLTRLNYSGQFAIVYTLWRGYCKLPSHWQRFYSSLLYNNKINYLYTTITHPPENTSTISAPDFYQQRSRVVHCYSASLLVFGYSSMA